MPRRRSSQQRLRRKPRAVAHNVASTPTPQEKKIPRGVTLKTLSRVTMLFALLCLGAFVAGRPPASASGVAMSSTAEETAHVSRIKNRRISGQKPERGRGVVQHSAREAALF